MSAAYIAHRRIATASRWPWFPAPFDLNVLVIRANTPDDTDRFDDAFVVSYTTPDHTHVTRAWPCTADPGRYYRAHPLNPLGTARIRPGRYHLSHTLGVHKGRPALRQVGTLQVDRCRGGAWSPHAAPASCALNIHAGPDLDAEETEEARVGRWSAGCVVLPLAESMAAVLRLVRSQVTAGYGPAVSLCLVHAGPSGPEADLVRLAHGGGA